LTRDGQITDTELLDVFGIQGQGVEGLPPAEVAPIMRELIEILWAEPDPDTPPGDQLHGELTELTEFLESEETIGLVAAMQEVLGAFAAGTLPWTAEVSDHMRQGAEAIAEELNPDPPRQKLEEVVGGGNPGAVVLAVGLDEPARSALSEALDELGAGDATVVTAPNADEAEAQWQQQPPVLALVDEAVDGSDHTLLGRLRHHDLWTPLVLTTAATSDDDRRRAVAAGANRILAGPVTAARLTRALEHLWA
jgi:CheY-like chemotaxis protein